MRAILLIGTVSLWLVAAVVPAAGQTTVYRFKRADFSCSSPCSGVLQAIDPDRPAVLWSVPIPASSNATMGAYVTPDGRYLVWTEPNPRSRNTEALVLYDIPARSVSRIPWSLPLLGNPRRTEVYLSDAAGPLALSFQGVRRLTGAACDGTSADQVSGDGSRVSYRCSRAGGDALVVFDVESGALHGSFDLSGLVFFGATLSRDGRELYVTAAGLSAVDDGRRLSLPDCPSRCRSPSGCPSKVD